MAKYDQKLLEEELKNKVAADWFAAELMRMFVVPANTFDNVKGELSNRLQSLARKW